MRRTWKNTLAVLGVTAFTALTIASGVEVTTRALGDTSTVVASSLTQSVASGTTSSGTLTCPATGCTASSCHATSGGGRGGSAGGWN